MEYHMHLAAQAQPPRAERPLFLETRAKTPRYFFWITLKSPFEFSARVYLLTRNPLQLASNFKVNANTTIKGHIHRDMKYKGSWMKSETHNSTGKIITYRPSIIYGDSFVSDRGWWGTSDNLTTLDTPHRSRKSTHVQAYGEQGWHKQEQVFFWSPPRGDWMFFTNREKHVRTTCFLPGCYKNR
jgi:hypothetical protein